MYSSPEDARSDLFLAAAMYLFGPLVVGLLLEILPLTRVSLLRTALGITLPLVTTVLVPWLLIRYRKERWSDYGFGPFTTADAGFGLLVALPMVAASLVLAAISGGPATTLFDLTLGGGTAGVLSRIAQVAGPALLALYVTVKARDAFRQDYMTVREGLRDIGRWVVLISGVSLLLLALSSGVRGAGLTQLLLLLILAGLVGSMVMAVRTLRGPSVTSRQVLLTPTVLLALGPFALSLSGQRLLSSLWQAGFAAGIGLLIGVLAESKRSAWSVVSLALTVATATVFVLG